MTEITTERTSLHDKVIVIILAGGSGTRMMSDIPKQFLEIHGRQMVDYSLDMFLTHPYTRQMIIVCEDKYLKYFNEYSGLLFAASSTVSRFRSFIKGFEIVSKNFQLSDNDLIAIHDSARPFISSRSFTDVCNDAKDHGAATLAVKCKNTIKLSESSELFVSSTLDRTFLWETQTPQVFRFDVLNKSVETFLCEEMPQDDPTDEAGLVERYFRVKLTQGQDYNIKVTTPNDFIIANAIALNRYMEICF